MSHAPRPLRPARRPRGARVLASAGISAAILAVAVAAPAQAAAPFSGPVTCKWPLVGPQPLTFAGTVNAPPAWPGVPSKRWQIDGTLTAGGQTSEIVRYLPASSIDGEANVLAALRFPSGFEQNLLVPLDVEKWTRDGTTVPNPLVLKVSGSTPGLTVDEDGGRLTFQELELNLSAYDQAGAPLEIKKLTTDVNGLPFADSDGDKYTFDVSCRLDRPIEVGPDVRTGIPPSAPTEVPFGMEDIGTRSLNLKWGASTDDVGVAGYRIRYEDQELTVGPGVLSKRLECLTPDSDYSFFISAFDAEGNESEPLEIMLITRNEDGPPPPPQMPFGLVAGPVTSSSVELRWTAAMPDPCGGAGVASYDVFQDGKLVKNVAGSSATITGLTQDTTYGFAVEAIDTNGSRGARSAAISVKTPVAPKPSYSLAGSTHVKTLTKGAVPLTGSLGADLTSPGAFQGDLALKPTRGRLLALSWLPVTANLAFVPNGKTTGRLVDGKLTTKSLVRVKVSLVMLFGAIPLAGGNNCQTRKLSEIDLESTDTFDPLVGGSVAGTYAISDLNGCGVLNGLVSPLIAGAGNTIDLKLVAKTGQ